MNADLTQRLPPELLYRIFDRCGHTLQAILCKPGHVCSRWRQIALRHPRICREAWLEGELTEARIGLFVTQLWSGMEHGLDVEINLNTSGDLGVLVEIIAECLPRCVALNIDYCATPDQLRDLLDALCERAAPRLRVLELNLFVPDSIAEPDEWDEDEEDHEDHEPLVIPSNLFAGNAPALRTLKFQCMDEWVLLPAQPISAFRHVETFELGHSWSSCTDLGRLVPHLPLIRHLYVVSVWRVKHPPPIPSPQTVAGMALESFKLCLSEQNMDKLDAWLKALDLCRVSSMQIESDVPYGLLSAYSSTLRGPLELSLMQPYGVLSFHAPKADKLLRLPIRYLNKPSDAMGQCRILMPRVTRLELPSHDWRDVSTLAASLPEAETLVIYLIKGRLPLPKRNDQGQVVDAVKRIACPRLRRLVLVARRSYCMTTADLAAFVRAQLGHEASAAPHLVVETRRVRLVGRRTPLQGLVRRIVQS